MTVFEIVTEQIVKALRAGTVPWKQPWRAASGVHRNATTGTPYRGINTWLLTQAAAIHGFDSPLWLTERQARKAGGEVVSRVSAVVVKYIAVDSRPDDDESDVRSTRTRLYPRYFRLYNIEQTKGLDRFVADLERPAPAASPSGDRDLAAEFDALVRAYPGRPPTIREQGTRAYYHPASDTVVVPSMKLFESWAGWAAVTTHELIHSTGHADRLARKEIMSPSYFASHPYSREEIVAEMGTSFVAFEMGFFDAVAENCAAYLDGWHRSLGERRLREVAREEYCDRWIEALERDSKLFFESARKAEKAAEYLLGRKLIPETGKVKDETLPPPLPIPPPPPAPSGLWVF